MKIEHVLIDHSQHFLVVDGKRGPTAIGTGNPAWHPCGLLRFLNEGYQLPEHLRGRLFDLVVADANVEQIAPACEPADRALTEYIEIKKTCAQVIASRYEPA